MGQPNGMSQTWAVSWANFNSEQNNGYALLGLCIIGYFLMILFPPWETSSQFLGYHALWNRPSSGLDHVYLDVSIDGFLMFLQIVFILLPGIWFANAMINSSSEPCGPGRASREGAVPNGKSLAERVESDEPARDEEKEVPKVSETQSIPSAAAGLKIGESDPLQTLSNIYEMAKNGEISSKGAEDRLLNFLNPALFSEHEKFLYAGAVKRYQEDFITALEKLRQADDLKPTAVAFQLRAECWVGLGDREKAVKELSAAVRLWPDNSGVRYDRGSLLMEVKQWLGAIQDFSRIIELGPGSEYDITYQLAFYHRSEARLNLGYLAQALDDINAFSKLWEGLGIIGGSGHEFRARIYFEMGRHPEAIADFTIALGKSYWRPGERSELLARRGRSHFINNDFSAALADLTLAVSLGPQNVQAYLWRSEVNKKIGRRYDAEQDEKRAAQIEKGLSAGPPPQGPARPAERPAEGGPKHESDEGGAMNDAYNNESEADEEDILVQFASFYDERKYDFEEAAGEIMRMVYDGEIHDYEGYTVMEHFDVRRNLSPDERTLWLALMDFMNGAEPPDIQSLALVLTRYLGRDFIYGLIEQWGGDIIEGLTAAIKLEPHNTHLYRERGHRYFEAKQWNSALLDYTKAVMSTPQDLDLIERMAIAHYQTGKYQEAAVELTKVLPIRANASLVALRGEAFYRLGLYSEALTDLNWVLQFNNRTGIDAFKVFYMRGSAYYQLLKIDEALKSLQEAQKLNPDSGEVKALIYKIQSIKDAAEKRKADQKPDPPKPENQPEEKKPDPPPAAPGKPKLRVAPNNFSLPGRLELETFFREHIIDVMENQARYCPFGIDFPSPMVLHGPPGCGKTFAVQALVDYLGWPLFTISSDTVGATFIHETSMRIGDVFKKAGEQTPAVVVIDEMDAFFASRDGSRGRWEVEEVSALLLHVQAARKNRVLVIGMTNRIESLDKALLRRGRFDHVLRVDMPGREETAACLVKLLGELPCKPALSLEPVIAVLAGRPLSDAAFVVREAARLAARAGLSAIDDDCLCRAAGVRREGEIVGIPAEEARPQRKKKSEPFVLTGRKDLENFFQNHIIDVVNNDKWYQPLGVKFPAPVVLHGPPGCGKTFAVDALAEYLGWPTFTISAGTIGSIYIHGTSVKIAEMFDEAKAKAPSLLVIDEMDSYLSTRDSFHDHKVEEVTEFLRQIQDASKNRVLVIGLTNRIEAIDSALLRRGRFDHVLKVGLPSREELDECLAKLLADRPCAKGINLESLADNLAHRPLSDVAFIVREAARLAGKSRKKKIDDICLAQALKAIGGVKKRPRA